MSGTFCRGSQVYTRRCHLSCHTPGCWLAHMGIPQSSLHHMPTSGKLGEERGRNVNGLKSGYKTFYINQHLPSRSLPRKPSLATQRLIYLDDSIVHTGRRHTSRHRKPGGSAPCWHSCISSGRISQKILWGNLKAADHHCELDGMGGGQQTHPPHTHTQGP